MCSTKCPTEIPLSNDHVFSGMFPIQPCESSMVLDSSSEFEFCVNGGSFECESSSADELFFNGVIVPTQNPLSFVNTKQTPHHQQHESSTPFLPSSLPPLPPGVATTENSKKTEEFVHVVNSESEKKTRSKSFWGFRRSNSVSFDSTKSSLFSLSLLSRSNSTGSVHNQKGKPLMELKSQSSQLQRQHSVSEGKSKSSFSNSAANSLSKLQKSQKKNQGGFYGKNLQVNHILNVPPPYITKETANIFGLSSLLRGSKEKKSRK